MDAIWFWFAKGIGELLFGLAVLAVVGVAFFLYVFLSSWKTDRKKRAAIKACPIHNWQLRGAYGRTMYCTNCPARKN